MTKRHHPKKKAVWTGGATAVHNVFNKPFVTKNVQNVMTGGSYGFPLGQLNMRPPAVAIPRPPLSVFGSSSV